MQLHKLMKKNLLILLVFVLGLSFRSIDSTNAFLTDTGSASFEARAATWPVIELNLRSDRKAVGFWAGGIKDFQKLEYEITYIPANREPQGISGLINLSREDSVTRDNLILGTNSSGTWVYDRGMEKIKLKVILAKNGTQDQVLEKEIVY